MAHGEKILPSHINLDLSPLYLGPDTAQLVRNMDYTLAGEGSAQVYKPEPATRPFRPDFRLPEGVNTKIGEAAHPEEPKLYVLIHNSLGNHLVYRIFNGNTDVVLQMRELNFQLEPEHFIGPDRIAIFPMQVGAEKKTYIILTDSFNHQRFFSEEDAMATGSFNPARHARFRSPAPREWLINLGIPPHKGCLTITPVTVPDAAANRLRYHTWRFRILYIDVYGRMSEHGALSDLFFLGDCAGDNIPCLDLSFDAGYPLVNKIAVEYQKDCFTSDWSRAEVIDLYEDNGEPWYRQRRSQGLRYDSGTNQITYRFCNDKGCTAVPAQETARLYNPLPRVSEAAARLGDSLLLSGNTYDYGPFTREVIEKIHFSVEKPSGDLPPALQTRTIKVYGYIYNPWRNKTGAIWSLDGTSVFGGLGDDGQREEGVGGDYGQYFGEKTQGGFIGTLNGGQAAISTQWVLGGQDEPATTDPQDLEWREYGVATDRNFVRSHYFMQVWEFKNVPPGRYIFRIHNHRAKLSEAYQKTSTYFKAVVGFDGKLPVQDTADNEDRELFIDVCEGDYDSMEDNKVIQLWDLTYPRKDVSLRGESKVLDGYVYESLDPNNGFGQVPIAGAAVHTDANQQVRRVWQTDHNGYYFIAAKDNHFSGWVAIQRKCNWTEVNRASWDLQKSFLDAIPFGLTGYLLTKRQGGLTSKTFYATQELGKDWLEEPCNRIRIKGTVKNCASGTGMAGITVGITNGPFGVTDRNGQYELIVHERQDTSSQTVIYSASGTCSASTCEDNLCLPTATYSPTPCAGCIERITTLPDVRLKLLPKGKGLQKGGHYGFGFNGSDWLDRRNFVQTRPENYLDIPTENALQSYAYSSIRVRIDPSVRFPLWVEDLEFRFTRNLAYSDFLEWVVDRFELIDNTGHVNDIQPTQIRIYYDSLNEYNKQYNFSTNSTWQFLDEKDGLATTDQIQFITNGDGHFFPRTITSLVRYDRDGKYILVDYTSELKDLKAGAKVKFIRPLDCRGNEFFYGTCKRVRVINGLVQETDFILNAFDSYQVGRQIPTPVVTTKKVTRQIDGSSNPVTYEEVEVSETNNIIRPYTFPFEHPSPSDFWGNGCTNRGNALVINEYEAVRHRGDEMALSGVIGGGTGANYIHYFREEKTKSFGKQWGSILSVIVQQNLLLVICEADHFTVMWDDNSVRVDSRGNVVSVTAEFQFGRPERKTGQHFGCLKKDRNTICSGDGIAFWVDGSNRSAIVHNFQVGVNVSETQFSSFLISKTNSIQKSFYTGRFLHARIDPRSASVYITDFALKDRKFLVQSETNINILSNETFVIDIKTQSLRKFISATPEGYAALRGTENASQFFHFRDGLPWAQYNDPPAWLSYFGVPVGVALRLTMATDPLKVKDFMAIENYVDNVLLYAPEVRTAFGQRSSIPRNWFKRGNKFSAAPFLCDTEGEGSTLLDGEKLRGRYIEVLLVNDPDRGQTYFELTGVILFANGVEKSGA